MNIQNLFILFLILIVQTSCSLKGDSQAYDLSSTKLSSGEDGAAPPQTEGGTCAQNFEESFKSLIFNPVISKTCIHCHGVGQAVARPFASSDLTVSAYAFSAFGLENFKAKLTSNHGGGAQLAAMAIFTNTNTATAWSNAISKYNSCQGGSGGSTSSFTTDIVLAGKITQITLDPTKDSMAGVVANSSLTPAYGAPVTKKTIKWVIPGDVVSSKKISQSSLPQIEISIDADQVILMNEGVPFIAGYNLSNLTYKVISGSLDVKGFIFKLYPKNLVKSGPISDSEGVIFSKTFSRVKVNMSNNTLTVIKPENFRVFLALDKPATAAIPTADAQDRISVELITP